MKPIRVLQVFTILNRGGAETNIMNYYRNIDRSKIQFDFLVHREEPGAYEKEIRALGGKIFRLPPVHPLHLKKYKEAVRKFFEENPDYQIIHGNSSELGSYIYAEAKRKNIPVIIAHAHSSTMSLDVKSLFRYFLKMHMRRYVNTYFTCSYESSIYLFGKKNVKQTYQVNNAIEVGKFKFNKSLAQRVLNKLGIMSDFNIVHVGSFNPIKNHSFIVEVFSELRKQRSSAHLFLIGEGYLKETILHQVSELGLNSNVTFLGLREDVNELLQAMDVFLFPSHYEGFGIALAEAQASGMQYVISDGIPKEAILVPENVTVLSLREKAETWAEKILTLDLSDRKDVSEIIVTKGYDIKENAKKLEHKYIELLEGAGAKTHANLPIIPK